MSDRLYFAVQAFPAVAAVVLCVAVAASSPSAPEEPGPDVEWQLEECRSGWYVDRSWRLEYEERAEAEHARRLREVDAARESCERRIHGVESRAAGEVVCHGDECANEVCWDRVLECWDRLEQERKQFRWDLRFSGCGKDESEEKLGQALDRVGGYGP